MMPDKRCQLLVEAVGRDVKVQARCSDTDEARSKACDVLHRVAVGTESIFHNILKEYPGIIAREWVQCDNEVCKKPISLHDARRAWPGIVQCLSCRTRRNPASILPRDDFFDRPARQSHHIAYAGQALGHSAQPVTRDTTPFLLLMTEHDPVSCISANLMLTRV